jgi:membrane associated rhomboid family serine protease
MGAGLAEVLIDPVGVDTGASGGVAGLIGALLVVSARRREPQWWPGWVLLRVLLALVAFGALALVVRLDVHGFGLVIGAALGFEPGFTRAPRARAPASPRRRGPSGRDGRQASPSAPGRGR